VAEAQYAQKGPTERSDRSAGDRPRISDQPGTLDGTAGVIGSALLDSWSRSSQREAIGAAAPPTPPSTAQSRNGILRLQRTAGNAAVTKLLQRPSTRVTSAAGKTTKPNVQLEPPTPTNTGAPSTTPDGAPPGQTPLAPVGTAGSLGEVEIPLPNVNIYDRTEKPKNWDKQIAAAKVFTIPLPDLPGVTISLGARGRAFAYFNAWFGPVQLQNLRVGMSKKQAAILAAGAVAPLAVPAAAAAVTPFAPLAAGPLAVFGVPAARAAALYTLYKGPFRASAQLFAPVGGTVRFGAAASLSADAAIAAKYSLVTLDAGVEGSIQLDLGLKHLGPPPTIIINYADADVDFEKTLNLAANLQLHMMLNAFIRAELLRKWAWYRSWNVAKTPVDKTWPLTPSLKVENKRGGGGGGPKPGSNPLANSIIGSIGDTAVELTLGNDADDPNDQSAAEFLMKAMTNAKEEKEEKKPLPGQESRSKHFQPVGTQDDPILIHWYKPAHWYADPIYLDIGQGPKPFRRDERVMLPNGEGIGVRHWPRRDEVFLITGIPTERSGTMQKAFRKTLEQYGFRWSGWEADHVWDLGLGGFDDYSNLWPLEAGVNNRASKYGILQSVHYNKETDPPGTRRTPVAIKDNADLASKYFKIQDFREP
jgi:hypothetical protein